MKSITVRKAEKDDAEGLSELFVDFIGKASDLTAMKKRIDVLSADPNYYVAVACDGDQAVGTAMGIVCYDLVGNCNSFLLIENVVVLPHYQGQGIGQRLMQELEEYGRSNDCNYVILVSESKREGSHRFYEAIGYTTDQRGFKKRLVKPM